MVALFTLAWPALLELLLWPGPLFLLLGSLLGLTFGLLPGLGGVQAIALLMPITFGMDPDRAIVLLIGAMAAVPFGGSVSAILINTPGSSVNAATILDGFPLARQGKAGMAIGAAATASCLGAIVGAVVLTFFFEIGRYVVLALSYPEYFMLAILGLSMIVSLSHESLWKGLISALVGFMFATMGYDPVTGAVRFTLGSSYFWDGIKLVPATIGLFGVSEAVSLFIERKSVAKAVGAGSAKDVWLGVQAVFRHWGLLLRSSLIGTGVGIVPGIGGTVANLLAYAQAVQTTRDNQQFGKGDIRGVIAPEAANNAKDGGSLVPTLLFGIPGSVEMAVLLGALTIVGIEPGPRMLLDHPQTALVMVYTLVLANILVSAVGLLAASRLALLTRVPSTLLAPVVLAVALVGAYVADGLVGDVVVALFFGLLGYIMTKLGYSVIALVIALVLGNLTQMSFHQTMMLGGATLFFSRPISLGLFILSVVMVLMPFFRSRRAPAQTRPRSPATNQQP